ncbi:hypothetical protein ACOSP7_008754 [Xanthoceras sorbifolium]
MSTSGCSSFDASAAICTLGMPVLLKAAFRIANWNADEEILLLEAIEMYGFGNWNEVAEHVGTKSKSQCIDHFNAACMNSPCFPLPRGASCNGQRTCKSQERLDERKRRKDFILERNLLYPNPLEKNLSPEEREIYQHLKEKRLCGEIRILPSHYLKMLEILSVEIMKGNISNKLDAHNLFKIEPSKVDKSI